LQREKRRRGAEGKETWRGGRPKAQTRKGSAGDSGKYVLQPSRKHILYFKGSEANLDERRKGEDMRHEQYTCKLRDQLNLGRKNGRGTTP